MAIVPEEQHLLEKEFESQDPSHIDIEAIHKEISQRFRNLSRFRRRLSLPLSSRRSLGPAFIQRYGVHLLPSFLHPSESNPTKSEALRKTAALDGLRGLSAFIVTFYHFFGCFFNVNVGFMPAYAPSMTFWNLPFVKYFYNGSAAVHVFFVISGYILTLRSLQQMKKRNLEGVMKTLSSSTFRRSIRLLAPITISMFVEALAIQAGLFDHARADLRLGGSVPLQADTLFLKLVQMKDNLQALSNVFNWADYHSLQFDDNLWTIGFEYRCSMAIFLFLLAICRVHKPWIRRSIVITTIIICRLYARWDFLLFVLGMLLADFDAWSANDSEPTISGKHQPFWAVVSLAGIYFCSTPMTAAEYAIGFGLLTRIGGVVFPWFPYRFAWSLGAGCIVAGSMHSLHLRWVLETRFVQYLGRVSYMLYVVHGPLLRSLGFSIVPWVWSCIGSDAATSPAAYTLGVIAGWMVWIAVVFWLADICTRLIDDNCVAAARWIEDKCVKTD